MPKGGRRLRRRDAVEINREQIREAYLCFHNAHLARNRLVCPWCSAVIVGTRAKLQRHYREKHVRNGA